MVVISLEKRFQIPLLMDCYGTLLTDNQREMLELYYESDLSLGEIAENKNKSRQAVHDLLKRSEKILFDYEAKLNYLEKRMRAENIKRELKSSIEKIELNDFDIDETVKCLEDVLKFLNEIY